MNIRNTLLAVVAVGLVGVAGCGREAGQNESAVAVGTDPSLYVGDPVDNGEISFEMYCVSCHGSYGQGDGPVAGALTSPPTDLTGLTVKYEGVFPADAVYEYVDGRKDVVAHGTRDMPVWGNIWSEKAGQPIAREVVDIRIRELVEYIRSIQE